MAHVPIGPVQYLERFSEQSIVCNPYALAKMGVAKNRCFIKMEEYVISCVPFRMSFKRCLFTGPVTAKELSFFQRYKNSIVGLSLSMVSPRTGPVRFFLHCHLSTVGQVKGRENMGLFVVDFTAIPDELVIILGSFLETQFRINTQYEEYGQDPIVLNPNSARLMGYTNAAVITGPDAPGQNIQLLSINTKRIEYLEAAGAQARTPGSPAAYRLQFNQSRISVRGTVDASAVNPQGRVQTASLLDLNPHLVEIIDEFYFRTKADSDEHDPHGAPAKGKVQQV